MKRLFFGLFLVGLYTSVSFGAFDYVISDTYEGGLTFDGSDSLLITGAGALTIDAFDESYIEVQGTDPLQQFVGGIYDLNLHDFSTMNYYGGETGLFDIRGDALATFDGGQIDYIRSFQDSDIVKHMTFIADLDSIDLTGDLLTGDWLGGGSFSITLLDQSGYDSVYSNISFQNPEPGTLALLGLGALVLRKKKK